MANKRLWLGMLAVVLAFGMMVLGCGGEEKEDEETDSSLTGTVSISGSPIVGHTLTANTSYLWGSGDISYQWKQNGTTNIGTDSSTYVIQNTDVGSTITVTVTRSGNSGSVTSAATETILLPLTGTVSVVNTTDPTKLFTAKPGDTLTATANLEGSGTISYQWRRTNYGVVTSVTNIGTNSNTYTVQDVDALKSPSEYSSPVIFVSVTRAGYAGNVGGGNFTITSSP